MDDRLPAQLSGGQQQRVAVARALAHRPQVLLMDEPFGALDAKIREELRRTIRQIQRELGMTTILVTHDQEEAFALADRIGVMHQGRLLECGQPDDLYTRPATRFVSTFLGAANLLLGYRTPRGVRFSSRRRRRAATCRGKWSRCCGRRKSSSAPTSRRSSRTSSATARSRKSCSAARSSGCACAWPSDGPVPVAPGRDGSPDAGSLLEVSRTLPEQRDFPVAVGQRVAVGARRIHVLPTPISSFTAVAADEAAAARAARFAAARDARHAHADARRDPDRPRRAGAARHARDRDRARLRGRRQSGTCARRRAAAVRAARRRRCRTTCVIHTLDAESRRATLAVAASLLRHVAAEADLPRHPARRRPPRRSGRRTCATCSTRARPRSPTTASTCAPSCVPATSAEELQKELAAYERSMLVLGTSNPAAIQWDWLESLLEGTPERPVLIVNAARAEPAADVLSMAASWFRQPSILPGFGLTLGFTTFFLSALVLLPLAALVFKTTSLTWSEFLDVVLDERALASYRLSFGAALLAATVNAVFGFIVAWSLVRYEFPGRRLVDALIDLPFALPTAVSGIALATVFSPTGWLGREAAASCSASRWPTRGSASSSR